MIEIWKDINGHEGYYQVSSHGRVKSLKRNISRESKWIVPIKERILKPYLANHGYYLIGLHDHNKVLTTTIHRLVASAFIPNPENKTTVNHISGIKTDNNLHNLEWASYSENNKHAFRLGLRNSNGENSSQAKLNNIKVLTIKTLLMSGWKNNDIAKIYNVCSQTVSSIKTGKTWKTI